MAELGKKLGILLIGNLILYGVACGVENMIDGKTFFGRKRKVKEGTYVDYRGNVHLGETDYQIC